MVFRLWSLVSGLWSLVPGLWSLVSGLWDQKNVFLPNIKILFVFIDFRGADASFTLNQAGLGDGDLRRDTRERRPAPFGDQTFVFGNISKLWFS